MRSAFNTNSDVSQVVMNLVADFDKFIDIAPLKFYFSRSSLQCSDIFM